MMAGISTSRMPSSSGMGVLASGPPMEICEVPKAGWFRPVIIRTGRAKWEAMERK